MRYKFFTNTEEIWQAMFEAIDGAHESVYLEMYIFTDNMHHYNFLKLLEKKAKSGLRVRVVLDSWGSMHFSHSAIVGLKDSGAELLFFHHFLHGTHRKVLIVDEKRAFIGGVNFSQIFSSFDDLCVEVEGRLVDYIVRSFAKVYVKCGGHDPAILSKNKVTILDKTRTWLVEQFPRIKEFGLEKIYQDHLNKAQKSIILVTPYFMPSLWLIQVLARAARRGARVEVLICANTGSFILNRLNYFFMFKLSKLGIHFYLTPKMNHAKVMIIDNKEGMVGSQNIDFLSFEFNNEIGVFFEDLNTVKKLSEIVKNWESESVLFDPKLYKPKWFDYFLSLVVKVFYAL